MKEEKPSSSASISKRVIYYIVEGNSQCSAVHELPTIAVENKLRNCNVCEEEFLKKNV